MLLFITSLNATEKRKHTLHQMKKKHPLPTKQKQKQQPNLPERKAEVISPSPSTLPQAP